MNIVERIIRPRPWQIRIVDLKFHPWRDPVGLDGREVSADYFGAGKLVGEVTGKELAALSERRSMGQVHSPNS